MPPGLPAESNLFGYGALVLVALNLATTEFRFLRPFGRWLLRRHRDLEGMFCSELIAKAMVDAGLELMVTVRPERIPPAGSRSERALLDVLVARRDRNLPDTAALGKDAARDSFAAQLDQLRGLPAIATNRTVPVGYPGEEPTLPPSLVTPNDLYRSPSFDFVDNSDGTPQPPVLTPGARRRRFANYVVALALTPVNSAIGGR